MFKRLRRIAYIVLASAILLEIALQVGAFVVYQTHAREPVEIHQGDSESNPTDLRILCVGDSYTFGDGASDSNHSYPMVMQRLLTAQLGRKVTVANFGWPGDSSRDVLSSLGRNLEKVHPHVVCVLIGTNDIWRRPQFLETGNSGAGGIETFHLRWRTARLFLWLFHDREEGSWERVGEIDAGNTEPTQAMVSAAIELMKKAGLHLAEKPTWVSTRPPRIWQMEDKAWALINAKNHIAAAELLETAVGELDHPVLQHLRVVVHQKLGNQSQVTKWLGALRESYKNDPTEDVAAPLLGAMWVAGKLDEAFYLGKEIVQRFPEIPDVWRAFSDTALRYDKELAIHCYRRFLETSGTPTQWSAMYVSGMGREIA
ncbi:MAG: SGNH/GDSL hydrolase family protein, partial [Planctomycetota bacterium]|nr:SGNH/GDSL hydrolase family protein [Planctomycetota bacterium]